MNSTVMRSFRISPPQVLMAAAQRLVGGYGTVAKAFTSLWGETQPPQQDLDAQRAPQEVEGHLRRFKVSEEDISPHRK